jgi:CBS domain-containing protein
VVDDGGKLVGIFSERDAVTRVVGKDLDVNKTKVGDVMTSNPEALTPDHKICYALNRMAARGFRNIPIVDPDGRPVGIVFTRHFVKFIVSLFPEAVLNLPPEPGLKHPEAAEAGG